VSQFSGLSFCGGLKFLGANLKGVDIFGLSF
jgi:hypothetical protein